MAEKKETKSVAKKQVATKVKTGARKVQTEKIVEKFLPIGTVAMLKGGKKRVMISGFCALDEKNPDKMWDYSGCVYPEGFISSTLTCLFDHEQIEKVYHMGLVDEEEKSFKKSLNELLKNNSN